MNNKEKWIIVILILITFITILIPKFYNKTMHQNFEKSIYEWEFNPKEKDITSKDFANLVVNTDMFSTYARLDSNFMIGYKNNDVFEASQTKINVQQCKAVIRSVFKDTKASEILNSYVDSSLQTYDNFKFIQIVNHQPVVFSIVGLEFVTDNNNSLGILYEERTSTLISCELFTDNVETIQLFEDEHTISLIRKYFEDELFVKDFNYSIEHYRMSSALDPNEKLLFDFYLAPNSSINEKHYTKEIQ